jgi:predicted small secreted protein
MRWVSAIVTACILLVSLNTASALGGDISDLKTLISSNEDSHMDSQDLAFFLATHSYNVVPRDGYVELNLNGKILKLLANGAEPGLCEIAF